MSLLLQVPMPSAAGGTVLENYSVGDVLIWKANRGKLPELVTLLESFQADVNYRNQVRPPSGRCFSLLACRAPPLHRLTD